MQVRALRPELDTGLVRACAAAAAVAMTLPLLLFAVAGLYSRYVADDFCIGAALQERGFWQSAVDRWMNWSGRFAYALVKNALASIGPETAAITPIVLVAGLLAGSILVSREFFGSTHWAFIVASAFAFCVVAGSPELFQTLLWEAGSTTYMLPIVLVLFWFAWLLRTIRARTRVAYAAFVSFLLAFVAGGLSETAAIAELMTIAYAGVFTRTRRFARPSIIGGLCGAVLATILVVIAPGNAVRSEHFPPRAPLHAAAMNTAEIGTEFLVAETLTLTSACALCVGLAVGIAFRASPLHMVIAAAFALFTMFATLGPAVYALSGDPPSRAYQIPHVFVVVMCMAIGGAAARVASGPERRERALVAALTVCIVLIGLQRSTPAAKRIPHAYRFASAWSRMDTQSRRSAHEHVIVQMPGRVEGLSFLSRNPQHWANQCVARYYDLQSIRIP